MYISTRSLKESIKSNAAKAIKELKAINLSVELLSGDQSYSVINTARALGISQFQAACSPQGKLTRLQTLKQEECSW
ncbi:MAG: hypothetical protein ABIU85_08580 [Methylotenera sp.]